jgi:uncharacterized protein (TIGR02996 family)
VHSRLLDACKAAPDDEGPRLVWADAIGGDRGELVVVQCDLARGGLSPGESASRRKRQRELLARHGTEWSGLAGLARRCLFRGGFVEAVEVDGTLLERHEEVLAAAPLLTSLTVTGLTRYTGYLVEESGPIIARPSRGSIRRSSICGSACRTCRARIRHGRLASILDSGSHRIPCPRTSTRSPLEID